MRKLLIILLLFVSSNIFGQQLIENKVLTFEAPKNIVIFKKGSDKANSVQQQNKIMAIVRASSLNGQKYIGSGLIKFFQYKDTILSVNPNYLEETKKMFDEMATLEGQKVAGYSSVIKKNHNFDALIVKSEIENLIRYSIYSANKFSTKVFNATIVVLKTDSVAGEKTLHDFIKSIKFK